MNKRQKIKRIRLYASANVILYMRTVEGFSSLLVCFAFIFCRVITFIRYIGVDLTFRLLDCVRYNEDFVISRFIKSRFCYIYVTVTLAGLTWNIVRYTEDFVI